MRSILIADDDPRLRRVLKEFVADLAGEVSEARDGSEAVALYASQRPDWVLMDWRMKPLDGIHATALIKAQFPEARIVIVSQYGDPELRALANQAGACACILKENVEELLSILTVTVARSG